MCWVLIRIPNKSNQGLHCLPTHLHLLEALLQGKNQTTQILGKLQHFFSRCLNFLHLYGIWAAPSEFGTYRLCEQQRFRWACASAQSHQNLRCSLIQAGSQEEPSDRKPDPWPLWVAGHAQLKFVMTECSKTQIRLTCHIWKDQETLTVNKPRHEKTCLCHMQTTKAQISLRISAVWSALLLFTAYTV